MKRVLVNLLALLSLLLSTALLALWVRSYFVADAFRFSYVPDRHRHGVTTSLAFNRGIARVARLDVRYEGEWRGPGGREGLVRRGPPWHRGRPHHARSNAERYLVPFRYADQTVATPLPGLTERVRVVVLPLWPAVVLLALPPAMLLRRRLRARRRPKRGLCARCGYDLRESPGRCPECGTAPPVAGARA